MNLTGIQIFKYLPAAKKLSQSNCKKCSCATCMAFALKLAQKKIDISACPYAPGELVELFANFSRLQQNTISLSNGIKVGGETVMFRHDKTFVNKTAFAIKLNSNDKDFDEKLEKISSYHVERVGETFKVEAIYLVDNGGNLSECIKKIEKKNTGLILSTKNYSSEYDKYNPIVENSISENCPNIISGETVAKFSEKVPEVLKINKNVVLNLDIKNKTTQTIIEELTNIRRLAILDRNEAYAHPVIIKLTECLNLFEMVALGSFLICRYANIIVFDKFDESLLTTLYTLRQGIYTDPQKPLQVEPKVYEICNPDENAIVVMTTNFALTYFAVANELESANIPSYLIIAPADGMSVLTAWSADKFNVEFAVKAVKNANLDDKVKHKELIIPGLLADMKDELQEEIPDWKIIVGTNEAIAMPDFVEKLRKQRNEK